MRYVTMWQDEITDTSVKAKHSQTFSPSRLNNYTNIYGGTIISSDIITNHYDVLSYHVKLD
jgi:hypothetical protein